MTLIEIETIAKRIRQLPPDRMRELLDFIEFLESRIDTETFDTMLASEDVLRREWDTPEEDSAWAHL